MLQLHFIKTSKTPTMKQILLFVYWFYACSLIGKCFLDRFGISFQLVKGEFI